MANRGETVRDFTFLGSKMVTTVQMVTTAMKVKDASSLEEKP